MNKALLWKDFALLKDTLLAALALLLLSYVIAAVMVYTGELGAFEWGKVMAGGASLARFTLILICALIGGHVYGREREDHSADFLVQLPLRGREVMRSKLIVSLLAAGLIWALSMAVLALGFTLMGEDTGTILRVLAALLGHLASGILVFGGAWLASFYVASAIGASFTGLLLLAPVVALQGLANWALGREGAPFLHWTTIILMTTLGLGGIAASFRCYVQDALDPAAHHAPRSSKRHAGRTVRTVAISHHDTGRPSALGALLWKDLQLMKTPLGLGLLLLALPYAIGFAGWGLLKEVSVHFRGASLLCIALGVILFTFWAGQVMSVEHTAKTAAFSNALPMPRRLVILSRLLVALCPALLMVGVNVVCLVISGNAVTGAVPFDSAFTWNDWNQNGFLVMGLALANGTLAALSFAWLLGARFRRPALAIVPGIITAPFCVMVWASASTLAAQAEGGVSPLAFVLLFSAATAALSTGFIGAGAALSMRTELD